MGFTHAIYTYKLVKRKILNTGVKQYLNFLYLKYFLSHYKGTRKS